MINEKFQEKAEDSTNTTFRSQPDASGSVFSSLHFRTWVIKSSVTRQNRLYSKVELRESISNKTKPAIMRSFAMRRPKCNLRAQLSHRQRKRHFDQAHLYGNAEHAATQFCSVARQLRPEATLINVASTYLCHIKDEL